MSKEILKGFKMLLLIFSVVILIFGIWFFFAVESFVALFSWPYLDPISGHYIGGFTIAMGIVGLLTYKVDDWERIEIFVISIILWLLLGLIAMIWGLITPSPGGILMVVLHAIFLAGFIFFYFQQNLQK
jgi:hypothetical protein